MKKKIQVITLDGVGVLAIRDRNGLLFTKPGIANHEARKILSENADIEVVSIAGTPKKKALKRNLGDLIDAAEKKEPFLSSKFTLIRSIVVNSQRKKRKKPTINVNGIILNTLFRDRSSIPFFICKNNKNK